VGNLSGSGQNTVVIGTTEGTVFAYDPQGNTLPGFPFQMPNTEPVHVSIGALGGNYPRTIVCGGSNNIRYVNHLGAIPAGAVGWNLSGQLISHPAAIGDIDGDGVSEIVMPGTDKVFVVEMSSTISKWYVGMGADISGAPTLADFDNDGDVEVVVPCQNGSLQIKNDDGSNFPGFPVATASGLPLSSAALAGIRGSSLPDIVFADADMTVEAFYPDGTRFGGYPQATLPGNLQPRMPVVNNIDGYGSGDVIMSGGGNSIWTWSNFGILKPGWPRNLDGIMTVSPAVGDLDGDGTYEVVAISGFKLMVFDTRGDSTFPLGFWPMVGQNPQRTGCLDCPEEMLSPVDTQNGFAQETRVQFSAPSPNPTNGPTSFRFDLPVRAAVRLDIFDLRGHKVRSVVKEEMPEGFHAIHWDGRGAQGQNLASGVYFARLRVRGPGLDQGINRKVNLLR